jgi:acyl carrier protein
MEQKMENRILDCIYSAIDRVNHVNNLTIEKSESTILFGQGSGIDSLSLVQIIIALEQLVGEEFGEIIIIADDKAFSQKHSPFKSVDKLKNYLYIKLNRK